MILTNYPNGKLLNGWIEHIVEVKVKYNVQGCWYNQTPTLW
jgi:hypothetical protein